MTMKLLKLIVIFNLLLLQNSHASKISVTKVKTIKANVVDFFDSLEIPAECYNLNSKDYFAPKDGVIDFITINNGLRVNKGELILAINQKHTESLKIKTEAELKAATLAYNRERELYQKKFVSEEQHEKAKVYYFQAKADYEEKIRSCNETNIIAENDGEISLISFKLGHNIKFNDYLFSINYNDDKMLNFNVPEGFKISNVNNDIKVQVYNESNKAVAETCEVKISTYLDNLGNYKGQAIFKNLSQLKHNSFVKVNIIFNNRKVLVVPETSIINKEGEKFIYIVKDNKAVFSKVKTGAFKDGMVEIIDGLIRENDDIITEGLTKVYDASPVEII